MGQNLYHHVLMYFGRTNIDLSAIWCDLGSLGNQGFAVSTCFYHNANSDAFWGLNRWSGVEFGRQILGSAERVLFVRMIEIATAGSAGSARLKQPFPAVFFFGSRKCCRLPPVAGQHFRVAFLCLIRFSSFFNNGSLTKSTAPILHCGRNWFQLLKISTDDWFWYILVPMPPDTHFKPIPFSVSDVAGCGSGAAATLMGALLPCPGSTVCHMSEDSEVETRKPALKVLSWTMFASLVEVGWSRETMEVQCQCTHRASKVALLPSLAEGVRSSQSRSFAATRLDNHKKATISELHSILAWWLQDFIFYRQWERSEPIKTFFLQNTSD